MKKDNWRVPVVKNYYYLTAGVLSVLFSFTHAQNGKDNVLSVTDESNIDISTKTTIYYVWHVITFENFAIGVSLIIMAFYKELSKVRFAAWLIVFIMLSRWGVILRSTLLRNVNNLKSILSDLVAILVYAGLIILGIRKR